MFGNRNTSLLRTGHGPSGATGSKPGSSAVLVSFDAIAVVACRAAVGQNLVGFLYGRACRLVHTAPVRRVRGCAATRVARHLRKLAQQPGKCDSARWIVVDVLGCYELLGRNPMLDPLLERDKSVVLSIGGNWKTVAESIGSCAAAAVTHAGNHEQAGELVHVLAAVALPQTLEVIDRSCREYQDIRPAVIADQLGSVPYEPVQVAAVGPDDVFEQHLGLVKVGEEGGLRDGVPVKSGILVKPVNEVILRNRKRRASCQSRERGAGRKAEPDALAPAVARTIPDFLDRARLSRGQPHRRRIDRRIEPAQTWISKVGVGCQPAVLADACGDCGAGCGIQLARRDRGADLLVHHDLRP